MPTRIKLETEYGVLRSVIVHRPGKEIDRIHPDKKHSFYYRDYLFEDIPYLSDMQREHDEFTDIIKSVSGAQVFQFKQLLMDVLQAPGMKEKALRMMLEGANYVKGERLKEKTDEDNPDSITPREAQKALGPLLPAPLLYDLAQMLENTFSSEQCAYHLISGLNLKSFWDDLNLDMPALEKQGFQGEHFLLPPSPNLYFMRDPAIVVQNSLLFSRMNKSARYTDSLLARLVFEHHPLFAGKYTEVYPGEVPKDRLSTIEGGDLLILSPTAIAIGCSERTSELAIQEAALQLLQKSGIEKVFQVEIPKDRQYMHLDTVFTMLDENLILGYKNALSRIKKTVLYTRENKRGGRIGLKQEVLRKSVTEILKNEVPNLKFVEVSSGDKDFAPREQRSDAANVFVLGPRKVISYARNTNTNHELKKHGVEVHKFSGPELLCGLGGPRCMTMPLERSLYYYLESES
jgi:arginine deiminase